MSNNLTIENPKSEICDHSEYCKDEFYCLICGKDVFAEKAAEAFDRWKDQQKYGE